MELRPGYKQTEVGVVPEDWDENPLHKGIKLLSGHHVLAQNCNTEGKGTPYITGPADFPDGIIKNSKFTEKPTTICRKDDILVTVKGSGAGTIVLADSEYCISRQLMAVRVTEWDTAYVHVSLRRDASLFGAAATGLIPGLSRGDILNKRIPIPPLPEQRTIARALSDVDALISVLDRLIAKKRDLKQAAMQQLLTGKTRLPGFRGEWEVKRLGDICRITTGRRDVNEGNPNGQFPFFTCSRSHTFSDSYSFDSEAILIAGNGEVGNLHYFSGKFEVYQRTYVLFDFSVQVSYLWQQLSANLAESLGLGKIGSSIPYIKKENLIGFEFGSPTDTTEQTAIAAVLSDMDAEIGALERKRDKTCALKQGMMQELLTGRIRLV